MLTAFFLRSGEFSARRMAVFDAEAAAGAVRLCALVGRTKAQSLYVHLTRSNSRAWNSSLAYCSDVDPAGKAVVCCFGTALGWLTEAGVWCRRAGACGAV